MRFESRFIIWFEGVLNNGRPTSSNRRPGGYFCRTGRLWPDPIFCRAEWTWPPNSLDEDQNFVFPGTFSPAGAIIFFLRYVKIALPSGSLLGANLVPFGGQIGLEIWFKIRFEIQYRFEIIRYYLKIWLKIRFEIRFEIQYRFEIIFRFKMIFKIWDKS